MAAGNISLKVWMSPELVENLFTRDDQGNRLRFEMGEPNADGFYTPVIHVDYADNLLDARLKPILVAAGLDPAEVAALDGGRAVEKIGELLHLP